MSLEGVAGYFSITGFKVLTLAPLCAAITLPESSEKYGIVALLVIAIGAMWKDGKRDRQKLEKIIETNTKSAGIYAEALRHHSAVLVEVKNAILTCKSKHVTLFQTPDKSEQAEGNGSWTPN